LIAARRERWAKAEADRGLTGEPAERRDRAKAEGDTLRERAAGAEGAARARREALADLSARLDRAEAVLALPWWKRLFRMTAPQVVTLGARLEWLEVRCKRCERVGGTGLATLLAEHGAVPSPRERNAALDTMVHAAAALHGPSAAGRSLKREAATIAVAPRRSAGAPVPRPTPVKSAGTNRQLAAGAPRPSLCRQRRCAANAFSCPHQALDRRHRFQSVNNSRAHGRRTTTSSVSWLLG
jgi:hypothetical protein